MSGCEAIFEVNMFFYPLSLNGIQTDFSMDRILFGAKPRLKDEFNRLFAAIFSKPEDSKKVVRLLASRHAGFTRDEISKATGIALGGGLSNTLAALVESDFIIRYTPYGKPKNAECYKLTDNFCLFWLKYVEANGKDAAFVSDNATSSIMQAWRGVAFEEVCWQHSMEIKQALQIAGIKSSSSAWSVKGDDEVFAFATPNSPPHHDNHLRGGLRQA